MKTVYMQGKYTPTNYRSTISRVMTIGEASKIIADSSYLNTVFPEIGSGDHFIPIKIYEETETERLIHYSNSMDYSFKITYSKTFRELVDLQKSKKLVERIAD